MKKGKLHRKKNVWWICGAFLLLISACQSKKGNHLSAASSPYLQEHADNPVDWYEWGEEALQRAKKENKPLLISVGYSACHWCHVMERESFMDTAVARVMNENFVCIKVDREERPDIDNIYMNACQLLSGNSGWPLNAFALPDGKPFFAGTYYSKTSWLGLLKNIANAYKTQNKKVMLQASALANGIANLELSVLSDSIDYGAGFTYYQAAFDSLYQSLDLQRGGLKGSPKFPLPSLLEYLLQYHFLTKEPKALDAINTTLTQMALGGIYDRVGGGFARYATDSLWRVPHFEKMLYDNGQLLSVYAHAYQVTGNAFYKEIVKQTAAFVQRDLRSPDGVFYSSLNADTKDGEGSFYIWKLADIKSSSPTNERLLSSYYNLSENGNWEDGKNILYASLSPTEFAKQNGIDSISFSNQLTGAKSALLTSRNRREKPTIDDKLLASWNALALEGFLDAYAALGDNAYLQTAMTNARFLETNFVQPSGQVWRVYKDGRASVTGFLEDYALVASAFIRLYQLTFDKHWLETAKKLTDYAAEHFYDAKSGLFYYSPGSDLAVIRKIEITDNSLPSANAVMAENLYRLSVYFEDDNYRNRAEKMLSRLSAQLRGGDVTRLMQWCQVAGLLSAGTDEVAIAGPQALPLNLSLQKSYLPLSLFLGTTSDENLPLLEGKSIQNKTFIYVCKNRTCKRPVMETAAALAQLKR